MPLMRAKPAMTYSHEAAYRTGMGFGAEKQPIGRQEQARLSPFR
jgi:hypothetical protein